MYRSLIRPWAVILSASLAGGPGLSSSVPAAPVPTHLMPKEAPTFFPAVVGTRWVYQDAAGDHTWVVSRVEKKDDTRLITVNATSSGDKTPRVLTFGRSQEEVFLVGGSPFFVQHAEVAYQRPWLLLPTPHKVGDRWDANVIPEGGDRLTGTMRVVGVERMRVPAGTYTATRVDWDYSFGLGPQNQGRVSYWYANGVGLIQVGDPPVWRLKSFELGK